MHVLIGIPSPQSVDPDFAIGNLTDIITHSRKNIDNLEITVAHKIGVRTDSNRNHILQQAIDYGGVDYILWLDADEIYPKEILERYFDALQIGQEIDVIGCMYFKRTKPYHPVAYSHGDTPEKPFKPVHPTLIKPGKIYDVEGLGFGGMMVNMKVYEALGDEKWSNYGANFHIPTEGLPDKLTHDLKFCQTVKKHGFSIKLHGSVRPGHLSTHVVTQDDWLKQARKTMDLNRFPDVHVVMPTTDPKQAKMAADVMEQRAGAPCTIKVIEDTDRKGFIHIVNNYVENVKPEVVVYTAQDAFVGEYWLYNALKEMLLLDAGLVSFYDGKWDGSLASFGMAMRDWYKTVYGGPLFYPKYKSHYADTELTQIAKEQNRYAHAKDAVMIEVDYLKAVHKGKGVSKKDQLLFRKRVANGFDGNVKTLEVLNEFR